MGIMTLALSVFSIIPMAISFSSSSFIPFNKWVTTWAKKTLCTNEMAMGIILKTDKARVIIPMVMPPNRSVTQQQHLLTHGILTNFFRQKKTFLIIPSLFSLNFRSY